MTRALTTTPAADGFWMPGEFELHAGCWMLWPERADNWREVAWPAQQAFVRVAAAIAASSSCLRSSSLASARSSSESGAVVRNFNCAIARSSVGRSRGAVFVA